MTINRRRMWAAGLAVASLAGVSQGDVRYVDASAPPAGSGTNWTTAYDSLALALSDPAATEIRVAAGTYKPGVAQSDVFDLPPGVVVRGGYKGGMGLDADDRDFVLYETILSGDLNGNDDGMSATRGDNSNRVVRADTAGAASELDGLTIKGGNSTSFGGGMFIGLSTVTVRQCKFLDNHADGMSGAGGGVTIFGTSNPVFEDCVFEANSASWPFGVNPSSPTSGGGMWASNVVLTRCVFKSNVAQAGGGLQTFGALTATDCMFESNFADLRGGGINRSGTAAIVLTGCTFKSNTSADGGGIMFFTENLPVTVEGCSFNGNTAHFGGGICGLAHNMVVRGGLFKSNSCTAGGAGGAIATSTNSPIIIKCTIVGNMAPGDGDGICATASNGAPVINSCILWGNGGGTEAEQIGAFFSGSPAPIVNYSDVQGLSTLGGMGNIGADPQFFNALAGDYTLTPGSPCINTGDPNPAENDPDLTRADMGAFPVANALPEAVFVCQTLSAVGSQAQVRLDATGTSDPNDAASSLTIDWTVDAMPAGSGTLASHGILDLTLSYGSHTVTLKVTDPHGAFDEETKTITINPAVLSLLDPDEVTVEFKIPPNLGVIKYTGSIALPFGTDYRDQTAVTGVGIEIQGLPAVPFTSLVMQTDSDRSHWTFHSHVTPNIHRFEIDWKGAYFRYNISGVPFELKSEFITASQTELTIKSRGSRPGPAYTIDIGGVVHASVDSMGIITSDVPMVLKDGGKEARLTLPFALVDTTVFTLGGDLSGSFLAAPYLTASTGRFVFEGNFDSTLFPAGSASLPRTIVLGVSIGAAAFPGQANLGAAEITFDKNKWLVR